MEDLPNRKADRVSGESYLYNGEVRIWDGQNLLCEHGRRRSECKDCSGGSICEHGRIRRKCKDCGGSQICEHGRERTNCTDCGGGSICEHGRRRSECKDCGGASICEHGRRRIECKDCGGSLICEHGRRRRRCKDCGGSQICEHGRERNRCKICDPNGYIRSLISTRIRSAIFNQRQVKFRSTLELLGCSISEARIYIENQFSDGMSWENVGDWHIDHRRPCSSFDLTLESEQKMCFHHTNLQPMWGPENISKGSSFVEDSFDWEWDGSQWIEKE